METTVDSGVVLDTNVLLTATAPGRPLHENALRVLNEWPNRGITLCTSGQVLREYLVVATRPLDVNGLGLSLGDALANVDLMKARMRFLEENRAVFKKLRELIQENECAGKQLHDANVVATALTHEVNRVLTINTEHFERFKPLVGVLPLNEV
jgi:predicted nucleic acid-binding protein